MLADIIFERQEKIGKGAKSFTVRALNLEDIAALQAQHGEALAALLEGAEVTTLLTRWPSACAAVIALAAGEPDQQATAAKLPIGVQVQALDAIWRLSEVDPKQLGELLGRVVATMTAMTAAVPSLPSLTSLD